MLQQPNRFQAQPRTYSTTTPPYNLTESLPPHASTSWYPDSRATHHVTLDPHTLQEAMPYNDHDKVQLDNGISAYSHIRNTLISSPNRSFNMHNILYIPSITKYRNKYRNICNPSLFDLTLFTSEAIGSSRTTLRLILMQTSIEILFI